MTADIDWYDSGERPSVAEGPLAAYEATTATFTAEDREEFRAAINTNEYPSCPLCGTRVEEAEHESVAVQQYLHSELQDVGTLLTLRPCGCRMRHAR